MKAAEFDKFADVYEADLNAALSATGENQDYFARGRVKFLANCLRDLREQPQAAMDYGCGIGGTAVLLQEVAGASRVVGLSRGTLPDTAAMCRDCVWWQSRGNKTASKERWIEKVEDDWGEWGTVYYGDDGKLRVFQRGASIACCTFMSNSMTLSSVCIVRIT